MAKTGDRVKVEADQDFVGVLMPSSKENVVVVKLDTGYNVGIDKNKVKNVEVIEEFKAPKVKADNVKENPKLPTITILHTGGTIASKVDYATGGVVSRFSPEEIIAMFPELREIANIRSRMIGNMWSQDMRFVHYNVMAEEIKKELESGVEGVIVTQGTDTIHYTSAALAFVLEGLGKPVLVVGAQRSSDRPSSDAAVNLLNAAYFIANSDFAEVGVCMHESSDDKVCHILPATKCRKMHTSRRDAFRPVNAKPWARVDYSKDFIEYLNKDYNRKQDSKVELKLFKKDIKVGLIKQHVNMFAEQFLFYKDYEGLIIESSGLGCLPITQKDELTAESERMKCAIKKLIDNEVIVCEAAATGNGRVVLNVYEDQRNAQDMGVLGNFSDMTAETSFVKLAWLLSNHDKKEVPKLMMSNLRGELSERTEHEDFLR